MKNRFLPLAFLLLTLSGWNYTQAQWTSLGSGVSATSRVLAGFHPVNENVIWGYTFNHNNFTPAFEFTRTTDGGQTWLPGTLNGVGSAFFTFGISALDEQTAWIATADELDPISGRIYKTTDGGANWTHQSTGFTGFNETPAGIWFWDANVGFAYGATCNTTYNDQIAVYTTADGGENWVKSPLPVQLPGEGLCLANFGGFFSVAGDNVWFGTSKNRIFRSADRGLSWQVTNSSFPAGTNVASIGFRDSLHGIALSFNPFRIARSTDGGETWTTVPVTVPANFRGWEVEFVQGTRSTWYLVASPSHYMVSYNDGETWETFSSNVDAWSVKFLDAKTGFAGSYINSPTSGGMYKWSGPALGNRLFVNDNAAGANDGTSWANAFTDLQSALAIAEEGDQIWVAEGTYKPAAPGGSQSATFLINKNLKIYGGFVGTETALSQRGNPADHPTVLSGDLNGNDVPDNFVTNRGDNAWTVLTLTTEVTNDTEIDGFTIKNGHAVGTGGTGLLSNGGGLRSNGNPKIKLCTFSQNFASNLGGAMSFRDLSNRTAIFEGCHFGHNLSVRGGAADVRFSNISFSDCSFSNNQGLATLGQPFQENGGAIFTQNSNCQFNKCTFTANSCNNGGGGVFFWVDANGNDHNLEVDSCLFEGNSAYSGGAIYSQTFGKNSSVSIKNSTIRNNNAFGQFAYGNVVIYHQQPGAYGNALIDNCLFEGNTSNYSSAVMDIGSGPNAAPSAYVISNCSFLDNTATENSGGLGLWAEANTVADFKVFDCHFERNKSGANAGAIWVTNGSNSFSAEVSRSTFINNESGKGGAFGSFQDLAGSGDPNIAWAKFDNCLFAGNTGDQSTISTTDRLNLELVNCTVANNSVGAVAMEGTGELVLQNTILANPGHIEYIATSNSTFTSHGGNLISDLSLDGQLDASSDLQNLDPLFVSPGNYHLAANSPCVDAGVNAGVTASTDLAGNARIQGLRVDMGAYESPFITTSTREVVAGEVAVSPNPASSFLNIQLPQPVAGTLDVQVFDTQGRLVRSQQIGIGQPLDLHGLVPGAYALKVKTSDRLFTGQFIKQ